MKNVTVTNPGKAVQLSVGLQDELVVIAVERHPDCVHNPNWLMHRVSAEVAREIAQTLLVGADLIEGKLADEGQFDANADAFQEHHG